MAQARILAFAGSTRRDSFNRKLATVAVQSAELAGGQVTFLDLAEFPLPLMDQDLEAEHGLPDNALRLKKIFRDHNGLLIVSPEYNSSLPPLLKNVIDWVSRPAKDEPMKAAYLGKVAAILAASPGELGGLRCLFHLRSILQNISVMVLPEMVALPEAHKAFADDGSLLDERVLRRVQSQARALVETISRLSD